MEKTGKKMTIDMERCKGCVLCVDICPQHALEMSGEVNKKGHRFAILKHPEKCNGCGLCFIVCPDCCIEIKENEQK